MPSEASIMHAWLSNPFPVNNNTGFDFPHSVSKQLELLFFLCTFNLYTQVIVTIVLS
jgi:hypothetical protein